MSYASLLVFGILAVILGAVSTAVAVAVFRTSNSRPTSGEYSRSQKRWLRGFGYGTSIIGLTFILGGITMSVVGAQDSFVETYDQRTETSTETYRIADASSITTAITGGGGLTEWKDVDIHFSYVVGDELETAVLPAEKLTVKIIDATEEERVEVVTVTQIAIMTYYSGRVDERRAPLGNSKTYTVYVHLNEEAP